MAKFTINMVLKIMTDCKIIRISLIHLIAFIFLIITSPCYGSDSTIQLSAEEKTWIKENHTVRVRIGDSPPFMLTDGEIRGISIDYLTKILNRHGINYHYIKPSEVTWPQALKYIEQHDLVDMVPTAKITDERKKHMLFTDEYIFAPWVIFTRSDSDFVSSVEDLDGKTVSVEEGYAMHRELKQNHPGIKLRVISASLKHFTQIPVKELSTGMVEAYIGNLITTSYTIQTQGYTNVKVAAPTPFGNHNQAMAIRSDWPELASIINKTLAAMTPEEHAAILNRWLSIRYEYGIDRIYVFKWVLSILGIASVIIGIVLIWNKRLKTEAIFREETEKALKDSEEKLHLIIDTSPLGICTVDPLGNFVRTNSAYEQMLGYSKEELKELSFFDVTHPDYRPKNKELFQNMFSLESTGFKMEKKYVRKDGIVIDVSVNATAIIDAEGKERFGTAFVENITEQKLVEEALAESTHLLTEAQRLTSIGSWVQDVPSGKLMWSDETFRIFEIDKKSSGDLFERFLAAVHPDDRKLTTDAYKNALKTKKPYTLTHRLLMPDGRIKHVVECCETKYDDNGNPVKSLGTVQDITERTNAENEQEKLMAQLTQAQKMESVGRLAGGVAHDYNNISSIIIGFSELALEKVEQRDPVHKDLIEVLTAAKRSTEITRQLLAFARQQTIAPKVIDLNDTIASMLKMLRRLIGEDIDLAWLPGAEVWSIKIDPSQVDQIMANLCVNSRDAIDDVGKVTVETRNVSFNEDYCVDHKGFSPGEYVLLAVSDDGSGIAPENLEKIFEPFFTTKGMGEGTGLGMATVYGIVKQNNGFINVYSEQGEGTTIKIYLSRHLGQAESVSREETLEIPLSCGETVLLVEDDTSILKLGKRILEELGYTVLAANTINEAVRLAEEHAGEIHLLITDVVMPEMNGRQLSELLQKAYVNLKVLFMSGYTANVIVHRGVLDDGVCFMPKPFSKKDMAVKVREVLGGNNATTHF